MSVDSVLAALSDAGLGPGDRLGLVVSPALGTGLAWVGGSMAVEASACDPPTLVRAIESAIRPRWTMWSAATTAPLVAAGVRVSTSWDVAAVHCVLTGGWRADPARVWAELHGLALDTLPVEGPADLFNQPEADDPAAEQPVRADGHLRPDWAAGGWADGLERLRAWAALALAASGLQQQRLAELADRPAAASTARSESTAELLCTELTADGLPLDRTIAETIIAGFVGPRPRTESEAAAQRAERDAVVLALAPSDSKFDLRSPGQVKSLLRRVGVEVPDTRAWRLEAVRHEHPLVDALLVWRKAERVSTTFGYRWLDENLGPDGRLHGEWTGCDGAAGRMTATAGLHNMPADLRPAVAAEPGHLFVRADLGQIEPRVLATISGDAALARAAQEPDLYAPVAERLGVDRPTAKVAVLGAMYGQTTGHGAQALRGLQQSYPVAMAYLEEGDRAGRTGQDVRTYGGRLVRLGAVRDPEMDERNARSRAAAMGRYGRNALVQGAAAELFKVWAVTVRARTAALGARIVLCLHDELLVHVPAEHAEAVADLVAQCLEEAAQRWAPGTPVRFLADTSVIARWSDAK